MFARGFTVAAPAFDLFNKLTGANLYENNLKRLPELERSRMQEFIRTHIRPFYFDVMKRKLKSKQTIEKTF